MGLIYKNVSNSIFFHKTLAQRGFAQGGPAQLAVISAPNPALHDGSLYFIYQSP